MSLGSTGIPLTESNNPLPSLGQQQSIPAFILVFLNFLSQGWDSTIYFFHYLLASEWFYWGLSFLVFAFVRYIYRTLRTSWIKYESKAKKMN